jgi:hypothetical protein
MRRIRFHGLVRLANRVRTELAGPVSVEHRERLRAHVQRAVSVVSATLAQHGADLRAVPAPSRRAVAFLRSIDFDQVAVSEVALPAAPPGNLYVPGLRAYIADITERMARAVAGVMPPPADPGCEAVRLEIAALAESLNGRLASGMSLDRLNPQSRDAAAWVLLFGNASRYGQYLAAVRRALDVFEGMVPRSLWPRPLLVSFRPMRSLYRFRTRPDGTEICLATPFVGVDDAGFQTLAAHMFRTSRRPRQELFDLTVSPGYQELARALDCGGGATQQVKGLAHDLDESFQRVNGRYFAGTMARPRLKWSGTLTGRKFGHYNFADDTLVVSSTLDRPGIPAFVIDHVMHHELLHKKHGLQWNSGRGCAHTPAFREEERQFEQFDEADAWLQKLAGERPR